MSTKTEWTDETWNPVIGCSRVGPGCGHCYATGVVHRAMSPQHVGLTAKPDGERVDWTGEVRVAEQVLDKPLRWKRPRRIFVNSLSDLFHPDLDRRPIYRIFATMMCAEQHTFQVLTKRPQRMAELLADPSFRDDVHGEAVAAWPGRPGKPAPSWWTGAKPWPLPNVWLGTSTENDRYTFRADHLRATPAAVRWTSAEPLLGPLPSLDLTGVDWVVAGGESGPGARPMHPDWVRDLRDRCLARSPGASYEVAEHGHVGVRTRPLPDRGPAFLFKQWGDWGPAGSHPGPDHHVDLAGTLAGPGESAPTYVDRREKAATHRWGKKAAGRELDGRTWDEYPEALS